MKRRAFLGTAIGSLIAGTSLAQATTAPNLNPSPLVALPAPTVASLIPDTIVESVTSNTSPVVIEPEVGSHKLIRQPDGTHVNYLFAYYHTEVEYTTSYSPDVEDILLVPLLLLQWQITKTWFRVGSQLYYGHLERQELTKQTNLP